MRVTGKAAVPSSFAILARRQDNIGNGLVCLGCIGSAQARIQDELFAVGCLGCARRLFEVLELAAEVSSKGV